MAMSAATALSVCEAGSGVLIVSPNGDVRNNLTARVKSDRWRLREAVSGAHALDQLESDEFELLLLDPALPDLNAREFESLVRAQFPPRMQEPLRQPLSDRTSAPLPGMIGDSPAMQRVYHLTELVARRDTTVLVTGPSGTGKDLVAQAVHTLSARRHNPFVVINCAAIPEPLLDAELFGYTKGAFT